MRRRAPDDKQLTNVLHGRRIELGANALEQRVALVALIAENSHFDQLVREQVDIDFMEHRWGESLLADAHHGVKMMRLRAQRAALVRGQ